MTVYFIKTEGIFPGQKLPVFNKRGNCLEFYSRKHAEVFVHMYPEAIRGRWYEICTHVYTEDTADSMEYGRKENIWEGMPDHKDHKPKTKGGDQIDGQMDIFDFIK